MRERHQARRTRESQITVVLHPLIGSGFRVSSAGMQRHTHADRGGIPIFVLQATLGVQGRVQRIERRMKGGTEGVADNPEDFTPVGTNSLAEDRMMPGE